MPEVGIWRRRLNPDSDEFVYGIGDYPRKYDNLDDAKDALDALIAENNKGFGNGPDRAYKRLQNAGHPLFQRKS